MRKKISINLLCFVSFLALTGCGVKGPLYQIIEEPVKEEQETKQIKNETVNTQSQEQ